MEMPRNTVVKNGIVYNLPIGLRFKPTDQELIVHYLEKRINYSLPLPITFIPDLEVFHLNPWDLPGNVKERRYFFAHKKMDLTNKGKGKVSTDCGYWKGTNKEKQIMAPASGGVIGLRKYGVFYKRENGVGLRTGWVMQVFCMVGFETEPDTTERVMTQVGDWVVCRVYERKMRERNRRSQNLGVAAATAAETTSCSSGITEVSSNELVDEEASSRRY